MQVERITLTPIDGDNRRQRLRPRRSPVQTHCSLLLEASTRISASTAYPGETMSRRYHSFTLLALACVVCASIFLLAPPRASAELEVSCARNTVTVTASPQNEPVGDYLSKLWTRTAGSGWVDGPWTRYQVDPDHTIVVLGGNGGIGPQVSFTARRADLQFYEMRAYWDGAAWTTRRDQWVPISQLLWWVPGAENSIISSYYTRDLQGPDAWCQT